MVHGREGTAVLPEGCHAEDHCKPLCCLRRVNLVLLVPCHHSSMPGAPFPSVEGRGLSTTASHLEILSIHLDSQCHSQVIHACV